MNLFKLNDYTYYTDYEELRDRPRLCYIKGDNFSVAIDAGHSDNHVNEFYSLLKQNNLALPKLTILTHWHWDHTFAMHAVNGLTLASEKTNKHLIDFINGQNETEDRKFRELDPSIANEYPLEKKIIVKTADIIYNGKITIDLGNTTLEVFESVSPHTDDCTLIYMPKEKIIFVGDGTCGVFPTWKSDPVKGEEMIKLLNKYDINISIGGHWENQNKKELLESIRQGY